MSFYNFQLVLPISDFQFCKHLMTIEFESVIISAQVLRHIHTCLKLLPFKLTMAKATFLFHSVLFRSAPLRSVPVHSVPLLSVTLRSTLLRSVPFRSVSGIRSTAFRSVPLHVFSKRKQQTNKNKTRQ